MNEWHGYVLEDYDLAAFPVGARVLDLGFGRGLEMRALLARGCRPVGVEIDPRRFKYLRDTQLPAVRASGMELPFRTASLDGIVCKVVIPLTDEAALVAELGRVLRPGGIARMSSRGAGYYLRYLAKGPGWKRRFYGLRALVNTWWYALTGRRLPGFLGDTTYQSLRRLRSYYGRVGLTEKRIASAAFLGFDVFIYHELTRTGAPAAEGVP
jgi:SAM-dependent methyltransferase